MLLINSSTKLLDHKKKLADVLNEEIRDSSFQLSNGNGNTDPKESTNFIHQAKSYKNINFFKTFKIHEKFGKSGRFYIWLMLR